MRMREWGEQVGQAVLDGVGRVASRVQERKPLPADLLESDEGFIAVFDAPGAELEDVQVRFDEGTIRVRVDRYRDFYEGYEMRFPGRGLTLEGRVELPEEAAVEPKESDATLARNGTLRVEIPKDPDAAVDIEPREEEEEEPGPDVGVAAEPPEEEPLDDEAGAGSTEAAGSAEDADSPDDATDGP